MLDEVAGRVRENMEGEGKSDVETRYKQVASQPRVRQWTNDATRAAWLARETPVCSPSVKQAPKLVWQEAPLRKPLCEDMRVQLGRASHAGSRRRSTFNRDDTVASSLSNNRTRKLAYISDIRVFLFFFFRLRYVMFHRKIMISKPHYERHHFMNASSDLHDGCTNEASFH